ncbi:MAG TPA: cupin domain-containing protein [Acetobacteraceae bacterium]|nr:cupin domain-containing protein [Acetobacteraceae bacterium]
MKEFVREYVPEHVPEHVPGRSHVAGTPALDRYYADLEAGAMGALWTVANAIEPWQPKPPTWPMLWPWSQTRPAVLRALDLVRPEQAGRRVVMLVNPGARAISAAVGLLYTGVQVMGPGECASAHRHAAAALRFIMEGQGAYTIVDGERIPLGPRDFVLTPSGTWHDHGVDPEGRVCIWQDGLDIPLVNALDANSFEVHPDLHQTADKPVDASWALYGAGFLQPASHRGGWTRRHSPLLRYPWDQTYDALLAAAAAREESPFDGVLMDYVNPATGGPVMPTIGAAMQRLAPGEHTRAHRHTGSTVYQAAKGSGFSIIDGRRFDWAERDIFVVPSWAVHEHANTSDRDDACLFSFHDLPVLRALGLYREAAHGRGDGRQEVLA